MKKISQRDGWLLLGFVIALLQLVKGLSLEAGLYPVMTSIFTYADGPVRRGLLPSILALLDIRHLTAINYAYVLLHLVGLFGLVLMILAEIRRHWAQGQAAPVMLMLLFLVSPILPVLAATTGYSDIWLVLMLWAVDLLLRRERIVQASLLVALMTLQHEIALVLALPLFVAHAWLLPERRRAILGASALLFVAGVVWLVIVGWYQPSLVPLAEARCAALRPALHPLLADVWDPYCVRHFRATLMEDLRPVRFILLPTFWLVYGLFPLALLVAGLGRTEEGLRRCQAFGMVALGFVPYGLIMLAWDSDRFILLSAFLLWRILDAWYAAVPSTQSPPALMCKAFALFAALQLTLTYPAVQIYGEARVLPPIVSDAVFVDARLAVRPLMEATQLKWPAMLDPATCIDPRCVK